MKADPDGFRWVWISFFATSLLVGIMGFFSLDLGHADLLFGVAVALEVLVVMGSLMAYARRVQRRLDREQQGS
jgi:hypothetical protein